MHRLLRISSYVLNQFRLQIWVWGLAQATQVPANSHFIRKESNVLVTSAQFLRFAIGWHFVALTSTLKLEVESATIEALCSKDYLVPGVSDSGILNFDYHFLVTRNLVT